MVLNPKDGFMFVYGRSSGEIGLLTALGWCVFPFILPDLAKIAMALLFCKKIKKMIQINWRDKNQEGKLRANSVDKFPIKL